MVHNPGGYGKMVNNINVDNVDNVDNLVERFYYGKLISTGNVKKTGKMQAFEVGVWKILCKCIIHERIHMIIQLIMLINMWIMWVTLFGK